MFRRVASALPPFFTWSPTLLGGLDSRHFITCLPQGSGNIIRAGIIGAELETATGEITVVLVFTHKRRILYCGLVYPCPAPGATLSPPTWQFGSPTGNRCRLHFSDIDGVKVNGVPINDAVISLVTLLAEQYHQQLSADPSRLPAMMGFMPSINYTTSVQTLTRTNYGRTFDLLLDKRFVDLLEPSESQHWSDDIYKYYHQRSFIEANNTMLEIEIDYVIPVDDKVQIFSTSCRYETDGLSMDGRQFSIGGPDSDSIMLYGVDSIIN